MLSNLEGAAQLVTSCATLIATCGGLYMAWNHNNQSNLRKEEIKQEQSIQAQTIKQEIKKTVVEEANKVQQSTNGIIAQLLDTTATSSKAEGKAEGVSEEKERQGQS